MGLAAPPVDATAPAFGQLAELLDVQVDQLPGPLALIAVDRLPGGPVQVVEAVEPMAGEDPVHGDGRPAQPGADPGRAQLGPPA